ncbi:hypothetical protein BDP67DRAFT_53990 [Colletotrichum lupini]|nr:hypothetical protein BDP67DRAFT_53990 [Colletotrichum lupini]
MARLLLLSSLEARSQSFFESSDFIHMSYPAGGLDNPDKRKNMSTPLNTTHQETFLISQPNPSSLKAKVAYLMTFV